MQEQQALLTSEPSLQPPFVNFHLTHTLYLSDVQLYFSFFYSAGEGPRARHMLCRPFTAEPSVSPALRTCLERALGLDGPQRADMLWATEHACCPPTGGASLKPLPSRRKAKAWGRKESGEEGPAALGRCSQRRLRGQASLLVTAGRAWPAPLCSGALYLHAVPLKQDVLQQPIDHVQRLVLLQHDVVGIHVPLPPLLHLVI